MNRPLAVRVVLIGLLCEQYRVVCSGQCQSFVGAGHERDGSEVRRCFAAHPVQRNVSAHPQLIKLLFSIVVTSLSSCSCGSCKPSCTLAESLRCSTLFPLRCLFQYIHPHVRAGFYTVVTTCRGASTAAQGSGALLLSSKCWPEWPAYVVVSKGVTHA